MCTLPSLGVFTNNFSASENTTFSAIAEAAYASLCFTNLRSKPGLMFKLSTDDEKVPWRPLNSPGDWENAIDRVRDEKAQHQDQADSSVDVQIEISDLVCQITPSASLLMKADMLMSEQTED